MEYNKSKARVKKYPWLKMMWKWHNVAQRCYFKSLRLIEWFFQKSYGFEEDELFFAYFNGECFGIDWKGCGMGGAHKRGACLIHDSDLEEW